VENSLIRVDHAKRLTKCHPTSLRRGNEDGERNETEMIPSGKRTNPYTSTGKRRKRTFLVRQEVKEEKCEYLAKSKQKTLHKGGNVFTRPKGGDGEKKKKTAYANSKKKSPSTKPGKSGEMHRKKKYVKGEKEKILANPPITESVRLA